MTEITLGALLRARQKSDKLKEPDEAVRKVIRDAANHGHQKAHEVGVLVDFFQLLMNQIDAAIFGNPGGSLTITIADSRDVKAHYPVARILGVKDWPKEDVVYVDHPDHEFYPLWRWFFCWCETNELVPYIEPLWRSDDERWYEIGVNPLGTPDGD